MVLKSTFKCYSLLFYCLFILKRSLTGASIFSYVSIALEFNFVINFGLFPTENMEQKPKEVCQKRFGGTTCCVPNCSSNSLRTPGVSFHKFPKETSLKQTWLNLLGISKQPLKSHKVCYLHFPSGKKVLGALPTSSLFSNRQTCNSKIGRNVEQMKTVNQCAHSKNVPTNESTSSEISVLKSELVNFASNFTPVFLTMKPSKLSLITCNQLVIF